MAQYCFTPKSFQLYQRRIAVLEEEIAILRGKVSEVTTTGGGWHDNAALDSLQQDILLAEARLIREAIPFSDVRIVEYPKKVDYICLGSRTRFTRDNVESTIDIVAYSEEDFDKNKVLYTSPLALALIDHRKGDSFLARIVQRTSQFRILEVFPLK